MIHRSTEVQEPQLVVAYSKQLFKFLTYHTSIRDPIITTMADNASQQQAITSEEKDVPLAEVDFSTSTAVVTGGSSGIGRAIAGELVARGVRNLVLVAKTESKLDTAIAELEASSPALKVRKIAINLGERDGPAKVQKQIEEWNWKVDILINNAGFARKYIFAKDPQNDSSLNTIDLMVRAIVDLSLRFLPGMVQRKKGGILNIGSTGRFQPVPCTAMYAASKAFIHSWSQAIREEYHGSGIRIACVVPGITETNLDGEGHGERRGPIDMVGIDKAEDVAKVAVDSYVDNSAARIVGFNNKVWQTGLNAFPDSWVA